MALPLIMAPHLFLGPWNISHHESHLMVVAVFSLKTPYYDLL